MFALRAAVPQSFVQGGGNTSWRIPMLEPSQTGYSRHDCMAICTATIVCWQHTHNGIGRARGRFHACCSMYRENSRCLTRQKANMHRLMNVCPRHSNLIRPDDNGNPERSGSFVQREGRLTSPCRLRRRQSRASPAARCCGLCPRSPSP